jgi:hypothetical protein
MPRMLVIRRLLPAALLLSLLVPGVASAGSVGFFDQTGFHFGDALRGGGGTGHWLDQGGGVELLLGSKGIRIKGRVRLAYSAIVDLDGDGTAASVQHSGLVTGGAHVELLPGFEEKVVGLYVLADVGVSPIVSHHRAYVFFDVGAGVRFRANERFSVFVEAAGWVRFEQVVAGGPLFFLGARIELD